MTAQAMVFKIIDECPAEESQSGGKHCGQCSLGVTNDYGHTWHFDIGSDAMNAQQFSTFFKGVPDGS